MIEFNLQQQPHRRWNPLMREWVLVSPHRTQRPWQGQTEKHSSLEEVAYDPTCYMCPGNQRAGGQQNPNYSDVYIFDNDYSALLPDSPSGSTGQSPLLCAESERGICRVMCFSPRHDLTLARMQPAEIAKVVGAWSEQTTELAALPWIQHVQIFENRGSIMGCSNPHPHCQIWANETLPNIPRTEAQSFSDYYQSHRRCLLCDYLQEETRASQRIVCENSHFIVVVPFWAIWPFEILLMSKRHAGSMPEFSCEEQLSLAEILKSVTTRYDNLFQTSFPYSMGFHQSPTDTEHPEWHFHAHFFPPLLRSATVRKFMVGYELLASAQRDITAETAAQRLQSMPEVHYLDQG